MKHNSPDNYHCRNRIAMNQEINMPAPGKILAEAIDRGQSALSEFQSKRLLACYGVPVTREALAKDAGQAMEIARRIGGPVALKACSALLMHKSERGLVMLNLKSDDEVGRAYEKLASAAGFELEGVLVQEMVDGQRELMAGLMRDSQFGPCVMLGLGGVLTEAMDDAVMRMAPVNENDVAGMMAGLRCKDILGAFRGQSPADALTLVAVLTGLGRIGLEHESVAEIDINPLVISPKGRIVAVDALVVLKKGKSHAVTH